MNRENFNILVVDDEKDYCDVLKMILTGKGYKVDTCGNGQGLGYGSDYADRSRNH